ncbi:MAG: UDP-N-acetylmuramoyl-L-alanyl-D-glutamate--2,6-diaminopimelate ligase [Maricaulaceae bacterium]
MKLSDVIPTAKSITVAGLTSDSRQVKAGMIFAAIPGTQFDGRDYIPQAIKSGAAAILSQPALPPLSVPVIEHENVRLAYSRLAKQLYPQQPKCLVAVTGTNGKSSTVEFLRQIWVQAGMSGASLGTLGVTSPQGYRPLTHTTPDAVALHQTLSDLADESVTHVGMEASSHGLKQYRLDGVEISASCFTNLTQDHFDYHPDAEDYFSAKARLFTELSGAKTPVVVNVNDGYGQRILALCKERGQPTLSVGWTGADIHINEIMPKASGQALDLNVLGQRVKLTLPLAGEFQVLNAVQALGLALVTGVKQEVATQALSKLHGVAGRMERVGFSKTGAPIYVDFAHTEDGLDKLLRGVRPHTKGRTIIVFGCGGDRDPNKRPKMGAVAAKLADVVIVTDDNPRTEDPDLIRRAVLEGCPKAQVIGDRAQAISEGITQLQDGDCLVVAGKGHESGQIIGTKTIPFNDAGVVRQILGESDHV